MSKKNPKEQAGLSGWQKVKLLHEEVLKLSSHLHIWYHGVYPHPPTPPSPLATPLPALTLTLIKAKEPTQVSRRLRGCFLKTALLTRGEPNHELNSAHVRSSRSTCEQASPSLRSVATVFWMSLIDQGPLGFVSVYPKVSYSCPSL